MEGMQMIGIIGGGESGVGAALLAKQTGHEVFLSDAGKLTAGRKEELEKYEIPFEEGGHTFERLKIADLIVKSPGVPDSDPLIADLLDAGREVISEIEFAYRHQHGKILAITGSNGKTTTTHLAYHMLNHAGFDVAEVGNVGKSFARQLFEQRHDWYVIEVSSFQLDGIRFFKPDIAVLLNITPDHLDRYGGDFERYAESKFRIFRNLGAGDWLIFNAMDPGISSRIRLDQIHARLLPMGHAHLDGRRRVRLTENRDLSVADARLIGRHNQVNLLAAALAAKEAGASYAQIRESLATFQNDPHRLEVVGEWNGVLFINDSKATNVDAVYYALEAMERPVIWIAGGQDKGNDYGVLQPLVRDKVKALICLGLDNRKINEAFSTAGLDYKETTQVHEAVHWAASTAQPGDVVLLSPACASFDLFENYKQRGDAFKAAVKQHYA